MRAAPAPMMGSDRLGPIPASLAHHRITDHLSILVRPLDIQKDRGSLLSNPYKKWSPGERHPFLTPVMVGGPYGAVGIWKGGGGYVGILF